MRRHSIVGWSFVAAGLLVGCTPAQEGAETAEEAAGEPPEEAAPELEGDPSPAADEIVLTGHVTVSGSGAMRLVGLQAEGGETVGLAGDLLGELTRLTGTVVTVAGSPTQAMQGEAVDVARYDVVSVDGETPSVGVLAGEAGGFRLEGDDAHALVDVPEALGAQVGAKIWVVGPDTPDGQRVRSYGVIRPAG